MSTTINSIDSLSGTLFGKTRRAILALLYGHSDDSFYLRQIVRTAGVGLGAAQRELKKLSKAGIILRKERGRQVYYQANPECPVYAELKNLVIKTVGVGDVLRTALVSLSDRIRVAFLFGSLVRGGERSSSDVDVMVVGDVTFSEVVSVLGRVQETIHREVNPLVYPPKEFQSKLAAEHHFLKKAMEGPKLFLIGDEDELANLVE
jgi:predicted nucleotidyltransferase